MSEPCPAAGGRCLHPEPRCLSHPLTFTCSPSFCLHVPSAEKNKTKTAHQHGQKEQKPARSANLVLLLIFADLFQKPKHYSLCYFKSGLQLSYGSFTAAISCWVALKWHGSHQRIRFFLCIIEMISFVFAFSV